MLRLTPRLMLVTILAVATAAQAADKTPAPEFDRTIKPLLQQHCYACHNAKQRQGDLDLAMFATADALAGDVERLEAMLEVVAEGFMPPKNAQRALAAEDRQRIVAWIEDRLAREARTQAGDPGRVVVRRLTNAELNYTLGELTGVTRDWTKDLPRDGSGGEGFSNTGQTLQMSAAQIEKYLSLAQRVAENALAFPGSGLSFRESPVPQSEWARLAVERLDAFCSQHAVEYQDITPPEQLMSYAYPEGKSAKLDFGPKGLRGYKAYSNARPGDPLQFLLTSHRLFYRNERLCPSPLTFAIPQGSLKKVRGRDPQPDEVRQWENLWLDLRYATGYARPFKISLLHRWFAFQPYLLGDNPDFEESLRQWNGRKLDPARELSFTVMSLAGFLGPLRTLTPAELKDYSNIQNSRDGESMGTMAPNHDAFDAFLQFTLDDEQLDKLWAMACDERSDLARRLKRTPPAEMQAEWAQLGEKQRAWQAAALAASKSSCVEFAARAWRRPLTAAEVAVFEARVDQALAEGQSLASAVQSSLVYLFVSPYFLYRLEFGRAAPAGEKRKTRPLDDFEIANRLSYFLWSSPPDAELRQAAARGELSDPARVAAQARRMLKDPRIRRFAVEMFGQWLGFYQFDEFSRPDPERYPEFDVELRKAMHGEAVEFCADLVANDRDVRLLLKADYSFLPTRRLAEHYGVGELGDAASDAWTGFKPGEPPGVVTAPRISLAKTPRRGVFGWGAVLTSTSHPLRTSPVLRGNWILSELLGIPTPPPPNAVPELPKDEKNDQRVTIAQLLARHRQDAACAVCHDRIDPLGLALENFDVVGRFRARDLNGTPIDGAATLHDGRALAGLPGLVAYVTEEKQEQLFVRRMTRKVLGYALGRSVLPADTMLLDEMRQKLAAHQGRFSIIVESIVTSPQFLLLKQESATAVSGEERK